jgi:hypothetical protein
MIARESRFSSGLVQVYSGSVSADNARCVRVLGGHPGYHALPAALAASVLLFGGVVRNIPRRALRSMGARRHCLRCSRLCGACSANLASR